MIEEVIGSILDAEDAAKKRVSEAEAKAAEIVSQAEANAEKLKKQAAADNKTFYAQKMREADEKAEEQSQAKLRELNAACDKEMASYAQNLKNAVKIIIEAK